MSNVVVLVGADKGLFVYRSDEKREHWTVEGPVFKGWKVTALDRDARGYLVGTSSFIYGVTINRSEDLEHWEPAQQGPSYGEEDGSELSQIWRLAGHDDVHYAGVADAGLFQSRDGGETWRPLDGLNKHTTRAAWLPGNGGLCAHSILIDPQAPERLWCGISAVGVFRSEDEGRTWTGKNEGVPHIIPDEKFSEIGHCVHALAQAPDDANTIYRQDHLGMFRTRDGGDHWERIEDGLPSSFGFPLVIDPQTGHLFAVPLESDQFRLPIDGRLQVYRSTDGGDSWSGFSTGLPQENTYASVMRTSMAVDGLQPTGVYFGATSGEVFASRDNGESWRALPGRLPRIHCVAAFVEK